MKTCKNDDSTLSATVAEGSYVQDSKGAWDARRNRSLRHASNVGRSIYGARRFKLSPALIAIIFGLLSMLLLPSTGRSQTVEELEQQISQLQSQISDNQADKAVLQAANDSFEQRKAELECELDLQNEALAQIQSQMSWAVLEGQQAERDQIARETLI